MSEGLERLRELGSQKIHEETHILKSYIEALLEKNFKDMNKVQFNGFVSILEKEYLVDLSSLRVSGLSYIDENKAENKTRTTYKEPSNGIPKVVYLGVGVIVLLAGIFFTLFFSTAEVDEVEVVDNAIIEDVQKNIVLPTLKNLSSEELNINVSDENLTLSESTLPDKVDEKSVDIEEPIVASTLSVNLKSRRWFGYIDLSNHKRKSKTFRGDFDLNASKDWLLISRPGTIVFTIDDETQKFVSSKNMRFTYIDSKLTKIKLAQWQKLNRGRTW